MSKTRSGVADCKHGIKPQFCLSCAKERVAVFEQLAKEALTAMKNFGHTGEEADCEQCKAVWKIEETLRP